jgi:hypothetical protein
MFRQKGAVLIVSLVFLLLITAIAASTLTSSTFQTAMINNAQQRETVFRTAETAVEKSLELPDTVLDLAETAAKTDQSYAVPSTDLETTQPNVKQLAATITYLDERPPIVEGYDPTRNTIKQYEVNGEATSTDDRVSVEIVQGIARVRPVPSE